MKSQRKLIEKVINMLLNIFIGLFGIVLLISIYNTVQTKIMKKSYADFFGYSVFEVQTGSMADTINPGDWIIVKKQKKFGLNDIVTYKQDGEFITHRIIESYNGTFVTKGDANNTKDDPIDESQIVGKVTKILADFGILKKTIFNPLVILIIIFNIFIISTLLKKDNKKKPVKPKSLNIKLPKIKVDKLKKKITESKKKKEEKRKVEVIKEEIVKNEIKEVIEKDDSSLEDAEELSKFIPVDISEIDDTLLEIANTEIKEEPVIEKVVSKEENEDKIPTKINLELFESSKIKKSKNIIDKVITIKIEELNELFSIINDEHKMQVNEASIKNLIMSSYIDCRYYNYYGIEEYNTIKNSASKIEKYLKDIASKLVSNYKGTDSKYSEKVERILPIFILISRLETAKDSITDSKAKNEYYKKEIASYSKTNDIKLSNEKSIISNIIKVQRNYIGIFEYLYKKLESPMFNLSINKLAKLKNSYGVVLEHNINFNKVYSDYIIDKTYNEGVIAEDRVIVELTMLSARISKDMLKGNFGCTYLLNMPSTLLSKSKKLEKALKIIDNEYAKDNIIFLVSVDDFISHRLLINKKIKDGYNWSVVIDGNNEIDSKSLKTLLSAEYIFVDKKIDNAVRVISDFTADLMEKVIYENIIDKVGSFGDE